MNAYWPDGGRTCYWTGARGSGVSFYDEALYSQRDTRNPLDYYLKCPFCGNRQHVEKLGPICKSCGGDVLHQHVR